MSKAPGGSGGTTTDVVSGPVAVHPVLASLFGAFTAAGIEWCLLRGESDLTAMQGDVDLLVGRQHRRMARHIAIAHGFVPLTALGRGSHRFFLGYHGASDRWIKLDTVHDLRFGPFQTIRWKAERECLARKQRAGDVSLLSAPDAFWFLLLHSLLDKPEIPSRHRDPLQLLADHGLAYSPVAALADRALPPGWDRASVVRSVRDGKWQELENLAPLLYSRLYRSQYPRAAVRGAANRMLRRLTRVALLRRRGFAAALLGPDGAGKSTVAGALRRHFYLPVRVVYMGMYRQASPERGRQPIPLAARVLVNWKRYVTAELHKARGRLVIFDRYSFDALLAPARHIAPSRRAGRWLVAHAGPRPDLVVLLDAPGELLHQRKGDQSISALERRRQQYLELASRHHGIEVVDATQTLDEVRRQVEELIWARYRRRHRSRKTLEGRVP